MKNILFFLSLSSSGIVYAQKVQEQPKTFVVGLSLNQISYLTGTLLVAKQGTDSRIGFFVGADFGLYLESQEKNYDKKYKVPSIKNFYIGPSFFGDWFAFGAGVQLQSTSRISEIVIQEKIGARLFGRMSLEKFSVWYTSSLFTPGYHYTGMIERTSDALLTLGAYANSTGSGIGPMISWKCKEHYSIALSMGFNTFTKQGGISILYFDKR